MGNVLEGGNKDDKARELCAAIFFGDTKRVNKLLGQGADPNYAAVGHHKPLNVDGVTAEQEEMINRYCIPDVDGGSIFHPMRTVGTTGNIAMLRLLLSCGGSPTAAIVPAAKRCDVEMLKNLIIAGANPNALDEEQRTVVMNIVGVGPAIQPEIAEGAVVKSIEISCRLGANVNAVNRHGWTALHYATQWTLHTTAVIASLLKARADPNIVDSAGISALHLLAFERRPELRGQEVDAAKHLLDARCDVNAVSTGPCSIVTYRGKEPVMPHAKMTPLLYAVHSHSLDMILLLISSGAITTGVEMPAELHSKVREATREKERDERRQKPYGPRG